MVTIDPEAVRQEYADESGLLTRTAVWRGTADGRQPQDLVADLIADLRPARMLEVGCGTGAFAARMAAHTPVTAIDQSPRLARLTAGRGVPVGIADVQALPFPDNRFDVVAALWMLYHVPDLDRGLAELRRVLRPQGRFVAVTNGDAHLAELYAAAGATAPPSTFSRENGEAALRRHFAEVSRTDLTTYADFPDHAATRGYLATMSPETAANLAQFSGARTYTGQVAIFVARGRHPLGG